MRRHTHMIIVIGPLVPLVSRQEDSLGMKIVRGTVVDGKIVVDDLGLEDGTDVFIFTHEPEDGVRLSP